MCSRSKAFSTRYRLRAASMPIRVRRKLLEGKPDWLKVLDTAAEKGDWGKPLPHGTGRGIAICEDTNSLCAQVAEVTVKPNGDVKVNRVTVALDTRYMLNPQDHCRASRRQRDFWTVGGAIRQDHDQGWRARYKAISTPIGWSGSPKRRRSTFIWCRAAAKSGAALANRRHRRLPALSSTQFSP